MPRSQRLNFNDGKVVSKICKLGSSPGPVQWFAGRPELNDNSQNGEVADMETNGYQVKPRRRAFLNVDAGIGECDGLSDRIHRATDPHRFARLPESWFWLDEFQMPIKTSWVEDNAETVLTRYNEIKVTGKTPSLKAIAQEFGKTRPTISRALDIATGADDGKTAEHRRDPKSLKGDPELEAEVARLHDAGWLNKEIAKKLGFGCGTVTAALDRLYAQRGIPRPDRRKTRHQ